MMKTEGKPISVTINKATGVTGLGRSTIYKLIKGGELTPIKVGRKTLLIYQDLEAFIESRK